MLPEATVGGNKLWSGKAATFGGHLLHGHADLRRRDFFERKIWGQSFTAFRKAVVSLTHMSVSNAWLPVPAAGNVEEELSGGRHISFSFRFVCFHVGVLAAVAGAGTLV